MIGGACDALTSPYVLGAYPGQSTFRRLARASQAVLTFQDENGFCLRHDSGGKWTGFLENMDLVDPPDG